MTNKDYTLLFKALSDETRLQIISLLKSQNEYCACQILEKLTISQPTLSYHMKILMEAKLVNARKQGTWMHYSLAADILKQAADFIFPRK